MDCRHTNCNFENGCQIKASAEFCILHRQYFAKSEELVKEQERSAHNPISVAQRKKMKDHLIK